MGEKLYKFLQINEEQAAAMIPALQVPWGIERQLHFSDYLATLESHLENRMNIIRFCEIVWALRYVYRNMTRRRMQVMQEEQRQKKLSDCDLAAHSLDKKQIEVYMKLHRRAFSQSRCQTVFVQADQDVGLPIYQATRRLDSRFNTYLLDHYGGPKAIRQFLKDGTLSGVLVKLNVTCEKELNAAAEVLNLQRRSLPERRIRNTKSVDECGQEAHPPPEVF